MIAAVVAATLHALGIGCLVSVVLFSVVALIVRFAAVGATLRHALWVAALAVTGLMPLTGVLMSAGRSMVAPPLVSVSATASGSRHEAGGDSSMAEREVSPNRASVSPAAPAGRLRLILPAVPIRLTAEAGLTLTGIWLAGAAAGLGGLVLSLAKVRGLKRRSRPLDAVLAAELPWLTQNGRREREIYLRLSDEIETPVAVGFRRPVVLIPTELATAGGLQAIEPLIMHEHAHLRRRDDWTNLAGRAIERIFWFNPLVWLAGRQIALEREIASDDAVVRATGRPAEYAKSLWQLAREMRMPTHSAVAPGAFFSRKQISLRIEALLDPPTVNARRSLVGAIIVGLTAAVCTGTVAATAPALDLPARTTMRYPAHERSRATAYAAPSPHAATAEPAVPAAPAPAVPAPPATEHAAGVPTAPVPVGMSAAGRGNPGCSGCDESNRDLRNRDLRGAIFFGADLHGADLRGVNLDNARLTGVNLRNARLDGASLTGASMTGTDIEGASLRGVHTRGMRLIGISFARVDLAATDLRFMLARCEGCDFQNADLHGAVLRGVVLDAVDFSAADLHGADLSGASFTAGDFDGANLTGANLSNARFIRSSFDGADLRGATTAGAAFDPPLEVRDP